jgi:PAS domain S-box-containing protein
MDSEDRKRSEQAGQEIEEQWKLAFESSPTMYFIIDEAGVIISANGYGAEQLGYTVNELVGRPVLDLFYEPDRPSIQEHTNACFEQSGQVMRWEARKIRKDGTMLWVRESANTVIVKRRPVLLVICEDITEQKRAEEAAQRSEKELRDAIENVPEMVFIARPGPSNVFASRRWREYTSLSLEDTAGSGWESAVHPEDLERHTQKWRVCSGTGEPFEDEARYRRAANGEYRWFLVRAVPLRDEHGNILRWYGILTDIEDRKRAEALLTGEKRILEMVAKGDSLAQILDGLCRLVEEQSSGVLASVLLIEDNRLRHGGAPSLPKAYTDAIDGVPIGPCVGSCGTAAYTGKQVIVEDIATDPLWVDYRAAALPHSLRACWSTPIFSTQGKVIGTFAMYYREPRRPSVRDQGIIEQITHLAGVAIERKLIQEALRRSEAYLAEAQRLAKTGSWAYNPLTGKSVYWSDEMFRILGLDSREGPNSENFWQLVHPEDRERVQERVEREVHEKKEYVDEYRMVLPDGTIKHVLDIGHPVFDDAGAVVEFVGTTVDVTERKRAEKELRDSEELKRRIIESSSDCIKVMDLDGNLLFMSGGGQQLLEIDNIQPYLNACWIDFWQPEDRLKIREAIAAAKAGALGKFQAFCPSAKGAPRWWDVVITPICNADGQPEQLLSVSRDITESKRAEQERERLRQIEADLARVNRVSMMGELTASLAHEIKQPITAAVNNAEACLQWLTRDQPDLVEMREAATEMVKDARRAAEIVTRTRSLFKKEEIKREVIDLNEVIRDTLFLIREEANRRLISVRTKLDADLPRISGDRVQLQQILINLMVNGLEAMNSTTGELIIRSQRDEQGRPLISVSDAGIGLPVGGDKIFDAFFTTKPQGTGMGLAISRSIVESHGGCLWATANSGPGATFYFTLSNLELPSTNDTFEI